MFHFYTPWKRQKIFGLKLGQNGLIWAKIDLYALCDKARDH